MSHKKVFIIAGEPSGDLHGSNLVKELLSQQSELSIACWGGNRMQESGARVLKHIDELAFMGFLEVAANLRTILKNFDLCKSHIREFAPDLVVLIDYPGFNLRMAKHIHAMGIKVVYYISPQIWAWKESRVEQIKQYIDHVFVILPFEKSFYQKHGVDAEYVGHPLLDELRQMHVNEAEFRTEKGIESSKPIIALLPGSRTQEITRLLQPMIKVIASFPDHHFVVSKVHWQDASLYRGLPANASLLEGETYELLSISEAAVVTSGTATLETALIGTPQVVVYKANFLSVWIARLLVKIKFISLVNLIMDEEVVTELIQGEVNTRNIRNELKKIIKGGEKREQILNKYALLKGKLGEKGASAFVANRLLKIIEEADVSATVRG